MFQTPHTVFDKHCFVRNNLHLYYSCNLQTDRQTVRTKNVPYVPTSEKLNIGQ